MKLQNSSANSFFKRETFPPPPSVIKQDDLLRYTSLQPFLLLTLQSCQTGGRRDENAFRVSKTPTLYFSRLCRSRVMAGNFPARNPVNRRRRCGRSWPDTFEREPVVGAEMGGHGEARLAGPDTAIYGTQGIGTVAQSFARLEFFQQFAPLIPRCFRFQAADRARKKIASVHP